MFKESGLGSGSFFMPFIQLLDLKIVKVSLPAVGRLVELGAILIKHRLRQALPDIKII